MECWFHSTCRLARLVESPTGERRMDKAVWRTEIPFYEGHLGFEIWLERNLNISEFSVKENPPKNVLDGLKYFVSF